MITGQDIIFQRTQFFKKDLANLEIQIKNGNDDQINELIRSIINNHKDSLSSIKKKHVFKLTDIMNERNLDSEGVFDLANITRKDINERICNLLKKRSAFGSPNLILEPVRKKIKTTDNEEISNLSELPHDILNLINEYLSFKDRISCSHVNKKFKAECKESITKSLNNVCLDMSKNIQILMQMVNLDSNCLKKLNLKIQEEESSIPDEIITKCTNLSSLKLNNFGISENNFSTLSYLINLSILNCSGAINLSNLTQLKMLKITCSDVELKGSSSSILSLNLDTGGLNLDQEVTKFPELQHLKIQSDREVLNLNHVNSKLIKLDLTNTTFNGVVLKQFTHLNKLKIQDNQFTDQDLNFLPSQLSSFSIQSDNCLSWSLLPTSLKKLSIVNFSDDFNQNELTKLTGLQSLKIKSYNIKIFNDNIKINFPLNLTSLKLNNLNDSQERCFIDHLCRSLTRLNNLKLNNFKFYFMNLFSLKNLELVNSRINLSLLNIPHTKCLVKINNANLKGNNINGYFVYSMPELCLPTDIEKLPIQTNFFNEN